MAQPTNNLEEDLSPQRRSQCVNGPIIVGAGPSGLATAACLRAQDVPFIILERADCIASLWQRRTYDRLKLHLPKQFCELPHLPFPSHYPQYPNKQQFIDYLEFYARRFAIHPQFNRTAQSPGYDERCGRWRVKTSGDWEYIGWWLVVATGENAEKVISEMEGLAEFGGTVSHVCDYKSGKEYAGKRVLVVGCGNSGMEVSLDLCDHNAYPSMVVRDSVHVLPREVLGKSTFELAVLMMKWLPVWLVDGIVLILSWLVLGSTEKYGLKRPSVGPLELKNTRGKTPVLDVGAFGRIKASEIQVVQSVRRFLPGKVELIDGRILEIDSVILATGYSSNVSSWLQGTDFFCTNGFPNQTFPNNWKGKTGLYAVGFTRRGISGAAFDAVKVAEEIGNIWQKETKQQKRLGGSH